MKRCLILLMFIFVLISAFSITLEATDIIDQETIEIVKDTNIDLLFFLSLMGLVMKQVQVTANTFTYKNIKYNKGAVIDVDEIEEARLLGAYPFGLQKPVITGKIPPIPEPPPVPAPSPGPSASAVNTDDLKAGGGKKDKTDKGTKSDKELLTGMIFKELRELAKSLKIKIPFGLSKKKLVDLILEKK